MNQIGSVTESIEAVKMSKRAGWGVMASHRRLGSQTLKSNIVDYYSFTSLSAIKFVIINIIVLLACSGETEDTFIADLSVGLATVTI